MYGALEGKSKPDIAREWGEEVVQQFRSGLKGRPPPMEPDHPHWHHNERKYSDLKPWEIPVTESLEDTMKRTIPLWNTRIKPDLEAGKNVMIVAHANSLRGIVKHIDHISEEGISKVGIPNGIPLVYKFDRNMKPIKQAGAVDPLSGEFLEKKGLLRLALDKEKELTEKVPGFNDDSEPCIKSAMPSYQPKTQFDSVLSGLTRLNKNRELFSLVAPNITKRDESEESASGITGDSSDKIAEKVLSFINATAVQSALNHPNKKKQYIVIIRHGKTEYNKLGIFTGLSFFPLLSRRSR